MIFMFIILIALSALFQCETAFMAVNKIIRTLAEEENNKKAKIVDSLLDNQDRLLSSYLVSNNLVNIAASSLTTSFVISILCTNWCGSGDFRFCHTGDFDFWRDCPKIFTKENAESICLVCVVLLN